MKKVFLHAPNLSQFGKLDETHLSLSQKTARVSLSSFDLKKIDFLIYASFSPDAFTKEFHVSAKLAEALGIRNAFVFRAETASSAGASAFQIGVNLILSGRFKHGLVVATEIMSQLDRSASNILLGSVLSDHQRSLGMSMAQGGAMITNRYLHEFGYSVSDLYALSKKLHDNGLQNPIAHIRKNLTPEIYQSQPMIAEPLGLYDISPLSDGSASLILSVDPSPVSVEGLGYGLGSFSSSGEPSFPASISSAKMAYSEAKIEANQIQISELHDAFTPFELVLAEDLGLCKRGEALSRVVAGLTHPKGSAPINASGGLKSRGHPVGASGLAQIVELYKIFRSRKDLEWGLAHSIGGLATNNFTTVLKYHGE